MSYASNSLFEVHLVEAIPVPGSPVPVNSKFYIDRPPIETRACAELIKPGGLIRIKAPQKMGKSSLILRIVDYAVAQGYSTVSIDFQQADTDIFSNLDQFLRWFCANVARQFKLEPSLDNYWDRELGSKVSASIYFQGYLLEQIDRPIVLVLDEVNCIFEHPNIAQDFLPLLRIWHEQAIQTKIWQKLRLAIVYSTEVYISLNVHQSPFNVGLSLKLSEFTPQQVKELAWRYRLYSKDSDAIKQLIPMVGGHPYLVHLAIYHLWEQQISLEKLLQEAPTQAGIYSDHLRSLLGALQKKPELAAAFNQVISSEESIILPPILAYQLSSMGLVKLQGNACTSSCELYRLYFSSLNLKIEKFPNLIQEQLEKENETLKVLVNIDELTQVANRRAFNNYLQIEWKRMAREKAPLSLILCDIDRFKLYNDIYGHQAGDDCLRSVAQAISQVPKRPSDLVARYGGEEFAIVLLHTPAVDAIVIAEDIRKSVKALNIPCKQQPGENSSSGVLTVSLGVASTIPNSDNNLGTLFVAADEALYKSKKLGRDRVTLSWL